MFLKSAGDQKLRTVIKNVKSQIKNSIRDYAE